MYVIGKRVRSGILIVGVVSRGSSGKASPLLKASPVATGPQWQSGCQRGTALQVRIAGRKGSPRQ